MMGIFNRFKKKVFFVSLIQLIRSVEDPEAMQNRQILGAHPPCAVKGLCP